MQYSVLIIDMQRIFPAANYQPVIDQCAEQIKLANRDQAHILFVEFRFPRYSEENLQTHPRLTKLARDYSVRYKKQQSGALEVSDFYHHKMGMIPPLKVCGVNTDCCVFDTVRDLSYLTQHQIGIVKSGCYSEFNHLIGLRCLSKLNRVNLI